MNGLTHCPCCGTGNLSEELIRRLHVVEDVLMVTLHINSGFRCKKHNAEVGGSKTSSHLKGLAADVRIEDSRHRFNIMTALLDVGIKRIGVYPNMIHADLDHSKTQRVLWYED